MDELLKRHDRNQLTLWEIAESYARDGQFTKSEYYSLLYSAVGRGELKTAAHHERGLERDRGIVIWPHSDYEVSRDDFLSWLLANGEHPPDWWKPESESPKERRNRLRARKEELKSSGVGSSNEVLAKEEGVSISRIKQLTK